MKHLNIVVAGLSLAALSQVTLAKTKIEVKSHTAADAGFAVNSHLLMGKNEAILVDAQFTRSEALQVSQMVKATGRELKTIFITHAHPDHYFGLEILTRDFPNAEVLASPEVVKEIEATGAGKLGYWKPIYKEDLTDKIVLPRAYSGTELSLEGEKIELLPFKDGESEEATVLYIPSIRTAVTGDVLYNDVHLWLAENRPEGWLRNLVQLRELQSQVLLPGHGQTGDGTLIQKDVNYIERFLSVTAHTQDPIVAATQMKVEFGKYKLPIILDLSLQARIPAKK